MRRYHDHPAFIAFLADRVQEGLASLPDDVRGDAAVIFSAHSLPVRTLDDGTQRCKYCDCGESCRYRDGLQETADLVAQRVGLEHHLIAWQSAGRTADPWWGPPVEDVIQQLALDGYPAVLVCSAGFVADHLEVLYDLDIEAKQIAEEAGLVFARTRMPNADPEYLDVLAEVVRDHMAEVPAAVSPPGARRVVVVGGGVTGLTVAYRLRAGRRASSTSSVLEAGAAAGGKLRSVALGDLVLPAGADSFLARKPWAVELCSELGIELETPGATGAYLWTDTGLVPLLKDAPFGIPGDVGDLFRWPGLSRRRQAPRRAGPGAEDPQGRRRRVARVAAATPPRRRGDRPRGGPAARRAATPATSTG